jgi:HSP20 family protein
MSTVQPRDKDTSVTSPFARINRMFDEWMRSMPGRRSSGAGWEQRADDVISVDEYRDGDMHVIRAELPGIDPDRDVEVTVQDGLLRISAERRIQEDTEDKGYTRHELRYGSFTPVAGSPTGTRW